MLRSADVVTFLQGVRLFKDVPAPDLTILGRSMRERSLRKGHVLFREGDAADQMFFIREGTIIISKLVTGRVDQVLARFGPGEFFGEMGLIDGTPRSATVQAETDVALLSLGRDELQHLIDVNPRVAAEFFRGLVQFLFERLRATSDLVAEVTRWGLEATGLDIDPR